VIYDYWIKGPQFWMVTWYDKDEASDLSKDEREALSEWLRAVIRLADR
jgi:hypothetical protein